MNYFAAPGLTRHVSEDVFLNIVIDCVCKRLNVKRDKVIKKCRKREVVQARFMTFYILKKYTRMGLKTIGDLFDRDHTTVINGLCRFQDRLDTEEATRNDLAVCLSRLSLEKPVY